MTTYSGFYEVRDVPTSHLDECGRWIADDWTMTHPHLVVWVEDESGDQIAAEVADLPADWDGEDPTEYERLERAVCEPLGIDPETISWDLR